MWWILFRGCNCCCIELGIYESHPIVKNNDIGANKLKFFCCLGWFGFELSHLKEFRSCLEKFTSENITINQNWDAKAQPFKSHRPCLRRHQSQRKPSQSQAWPKASSTTTKTKPVTGLAYGIINHNENQAKHLPKENSKRLVVSFSACKCTHTRDWFIRDHRRAFFIHNTVFAHRLSEVYFFKDHS